MKSRDQQPASGVSLSLNFLKGLKLWQKFVLLAVLVVPAIVVPTYEFYVLVQQDVELAETEISGLEPSETLIKLIQLAQQHRGLTAGVLGGNEALAGTRSNKEAENKQAIAKMDLLMKGVPDKAIADNWNNTKSSFNKIAEDINNRTINGGASFERHTQLIANYLALMDALLDYYKLSYDPDAHSYFLAKATLVYLPVVTEPFGQLRGFGTGLLAAANQQVGGQVLTEAQRARILTLLTIAARDFEDVEQTFSKVFAITPELAKGKLADEMKATGTATKQMLELARRELIETQTLSFDSSEFYKLLSQGIDQQFALADVAVSVLNEEFAHELAALQTRKYVRLGIAAVFIVLATLLSIAVARNVLRVEAERETIADKVKKDNDALNDSIIEILRSVAKAAQGDLTVQAPVREDVTGALSDAINSMADSTAKTLAKVAAASHEVRSASQEGRDTVHQTARGMNDIRGTIQETGKRIKRLGERSQEITGIVKLIDDIAERTSVLALNANMQAAVAGEAGRGFRVVADEVQRLAERSKEATDQIGKLVGTIQAETNDTMSTMDRAIGEVVKGGELAEKAAAKVSHLDELGGQLLESVELFKLPEEALRQAGLGEQSARGLRKVA